jgi:hypothetical protein
VVPAEQEHCSEDGSEDRPQIGGRMTKYNTNLAAEFYVLSCLHRLGATANLTLGNKKGVDIVVVRDAGDAVTVEVKGLAGKYEWPADNLVTLNPDRHFVALVCYEGRIDEIEMPPPRVWILPFREVEQFIRHYRTRTNVARSLILAEGGAFENAWSLILGTV